MSDAPPPIPADALETVEGLRVLALTQERRIATLEARAAANGESSAELRSELAEARAELRSIYQRLDAMSENAGPSWDWLNPQTWWANASEEGADRALRVFRQLVILLFVGGVLYYVSTVLDRILDAQEAAARRAPVEVTVQPQAFPDSIDELGIDADEVNVNEATE